MASVVVPSGPEAGPAGRFDAAVLFDRDGTLVEDIPYNGDPSRVRLRPRVGTALRRLRSAGVAIAVVTNQSGIGRGLLTPGQVVRVNRAIERMIGPIDGWAVCPHGPDAGCACRKPAPGLILRVAARLRVPLDRCVVVGDRLTDVEAAAAAGVRAILVPTASTRPEAVVVAQEVAPDVLCAVDRILRRWELVSEEPCEPASHACHHGLLHETDYRR